MGVDKPGPGEELNTGAATTPRDAATVIVLRGGGEALEVLLVKRNPEQRFMGGAWVFPGWGGRRGRGQPRRGRARGGRGGRRGAARCRGARSSSPRWITPAEVKIRFDTRFYLVAAPVDADPQVDGAECVDIGWYSPRGALEAYERDELLLVFPTIKTLEQLMPFGSADELLGWATGERSSRSSRAW